MRSRPKNISQPIEYWEAFKAAADAEGITLSEWIAKCCLSELPREVANQLSHRPSARRPSFSDKKESNVTIWRVQYSRDDLAAFEDPKRIDRHFGFPMSNVYSISLRPTDGRSNVHDVGYRSAYFGNAVAYREVKKRHPNAWIWDERYRFEGHPVDSDMRRMQQLFEETMGADIRAEVCKRAREAELNPGGKTGGRPDLAVFVPGHSRRWRFIEIKRLDRGDAVRPMQRRWLELLGTCFGDGSAIVLELSMSD